jgi:putative hydroxymethylpyrimidine transport system substrate-binding protein
MDERRKDLMKRTRFAAALAALLAVALLAACGEKEDRLSPERSQDFTLMLDFFPNADHAGIYAAQANGRFDEAGLKVTIRQPADPAAPLKQVAAGRADLAVSYEPEVLRARDKGIRVVSVGALVQKPLTSIISLPEAKIRSPKDLSGKRVGTAGIDYQDAYLNTILLDAGVSPSKVRKRNVGFNFSSTLLAKRIDASLGAFWNYEGVQLRLERRNPRIIRVEDVGVPDYDELVLVANESALERDKDKLRAFISALARGTDDLKRNPEEGIEALLRANRDLDEKLQRASVKVTLPLFSPPRGRPYGWQDPDAWNAFAAWMRENKLIELPDARGAFTNDLLPGAGL